MGLVNFPLSRFRGWLMLGTDATIAEHIAKIIEREYVTEKQEQKIKYLVPSSLGVGLVEGYNAIGFDRSLSKPHLRAEVSCLLLGSKAS
jgi:DNA topoisomerase IA